MHLAGLFGDTTTFEILLSADVTVEECRDEDIHGNTPLQLFDTERHEISAKDEVAQTKCREILVSLLKKKDLSSSPEECRPTKDIGDLVLVKAKQKENEELPDDFYDFDEVIEAADVK